MHTSRFFVGRVPIFFFIRAKYHTLADFLSPIFEKSYLHAFKKPQKAQKKITALALISSQ